MDIIQRNYYRMLRNGAFGEDEPLEPMSDHKWRTIYRMAEADHVTQYLKTEGTGSMVKPQMNMQTSSTGKYDIPDSRRLRKLTERERHSMDTSVESLEFLNIIMHNMDRTLNRHTSLRLIIEMGVFLRMKGDRVDFIKIERWLKKLGVRHLAELHGSVLIALFNFNLNELPFMRRCATCGERFVVYDRCLTLRYLSKYPGATIHSWFRAIYNVLTQIEE